MKDMRAVRFNEKIKRASTVGSNAGLALVVTAISQWYLVGFDLYAAFWLLMAIAIMFVSVQINELLLPEEE